MTAFGLTWAFFGRRFGDYLTLLLDGFIGFSLMDETHLSSSVERSRDERKGFGCISLLQSFVLSKIIHRSQLASESITKRAA